MIPIARFPRQALYKRPIRTWANLHKINASTTEIEADLHYLVRSIIHPLLLLAT
jgi:hypothetical protein